ncbi:MAG: radical SAM peptide maturase, CXXX-repeat target family [Clostridium sp.]|nr:radical SAM peptide maturase, CXXX-repeat target family [Clostridium sp.]MCM1541440.1 radical SAM peptide maturase, CXXX-repeat target family [Blautia sp.]
MEDKKYVMGDFKQNSWRTNESQQLTFVVTQDCNLRCKYCYMVKNDKNVMSFDVAKKAVDYFMDNKETLFIRDYIILDFIGGEALLEIKLIDQIVDYFRLAAYKKKSKWFGRFRINVQSNGLLVDSEDFQRFLRKNRNLVSVGITIDGTKEKHDLQRVFPNGAGSYDIVERNYNMAIQQGFAGGTKVTFGREDLKYLKDSIIHLWSMGIEDIPANVVYEDVWKKGDDVVYQEQLISLADYIVDNRLWDKYNTSFFYDNLGFRITDEMLMHASCGTGKMYCVDAKGDIYNCVRFMEYSLNGKPGKKIGDIYHGIDVDRVRPLQTLFPKYLSEQKCLDCRVSMGCTYCAGNNYDESDSDSLYYRSVAICDMHKARVRANNYLWARLYNEHSIKRSVKLQQEFFMYFILSSECVNYCQFMPAETKVMMEPEKLLEGLQYAFDHFYQPVFVHSADSQIWLEKLLADEKYGGLLAKELKRHIVRHIMKFEKGKQRKDAIYVIDETSDKPDGELNAPVILNINAYDLAGLADVVKGILPFTSRVNINLSGVDSNFDITEYERQLEKLNKILLDYIIKGQPKEIRQLTDRIFMKKMNNCFAGEKNITLAPDGKFYFCPAFYFNKELNLNFERTRKLTYLSKAPACDNCDAYHCDRCVYRNYLGTGEVNTPTKMQCRIAHLEKRYSAKLLEMLKEQGVQGFQSFHIPQSDHDDPLERLAQGNPTASGSLL